MSEPAAEKVSPLLTPSATTLPPARLADPAGDPVWAHMEAVGPTNWMIHLRSETADLGVLGPLWAENFLYNSAHLEGVRYFIPTELRGGTLVREEALSIESWATIASIVDAGNIYAPPTPHSDRLCAIYWNLIARDLYITGPSSPEYTIFDHDAELARLGLTPDQVELLSTLLLRGGGIDLPLDLDILVTTLVAVEAILA